jgi:hypothetical protein
MSLPPKHYPRNLEFQWAADPFDPRFRVKAPIGQLRWTPLGMLVQVYWWIQTHEQIGASAPLMNSIRETLIRECPDTLEFLERQQHEQQK